MVLLLFLFLFCFLLCCYFAVRHTNTSFMCQVSQFAISQMWQETMLVDIRMWHLLLVCWYVGTHRYIYMYVVYIRMYTCNLQIFTHSLLPLKPQASAAVSQQNSGNNQHSIIVAITAVVSHSSTTFLVMALL